ncbi:dihydropteroate synthase [Nocardioides limicola]|uniref:dihydropteroate synthase n=1 Tax=Nocardioides limicola TaxID=2803368 RepID=UPI00193BB52C|nr:dihydropteroate synthase [Nocardioides sp. DJM-14]
MTLLMGVVNVTPDSFSDGGRFVAADAAIEHGLALLAEGADILDVGGESTRPGATRPVVTEELGRVIPVITGLVAAGARVSVDTMRAEVAAAAIAAGATLVNDVSGGLADPGILDVVADAGVEYVAMHWRAHADQMQRHASYPRGVVAEVRDELAARVDAAVAAGVTPERIILDPGLGFAKTPQHNWELLAGLDELDGLGHRLLAGASRKSFLGVLLAADGQPRPVDEREDATTALTALLARRGTWCVRVHRVRPSADAVAVARALG